MEYVSRFIDFFFSFKAYVMLPIIIFIIALIVRMKIQDAFLSSLKLAVGFAGIFVVFDFFVANIGPAVKAIISVRGLDYPVLDVGWPPLAAITWSSIIAPLTIPLILLINLLMIATNTTRTIDIDIWNYWHFALIGALIQKTTGSYVLAFTATALIGIYTLKIADWTAPYVEEECGLKGICITTLSVNGLLPVGVACNKLFDAIPGFRKLSYNPSKSTDSKLKILNEPMVIGILVGVFLAVLAGYKVKESMELCVHIAAVMFLLPHCGAIIGKGMEPISLKLKDAIQRRFPSKTNLVIGMDSGDIMTNPSVLT
ncbi:MAG TPA: PTS transporter subunit IIC, partial [Spirochaetia bacterium]|nr:PTS transporter subunit IIC [Spirochaetia bacterium]